MKMRYITVGLFFWAFSLWGYKPEVVFQQAQVAQTEGDLQKALSIYQQLNQHSYHSPAVYINEGLVYQQLGQIGLARLALERALWIDPRQPQALEALQELLEKYSIEEKPQSKLAYASHFLPLNTWILIITITGWICVIFGGLLPLTTCSRTIWLSGLIFSCLIFIVGCIAASVYHLQRNQAIILQNTSARIAPTGKGEILTDLPTGSQVDTVDETYGAYRKIILDNGLQGWVEDSTCQKILNFSG